MVEKNIHGRTVLKVINIVLVLLTCLWFFPFYVMGIDFTDTGYYLVNYKYFFDTSVNINGVGTYFSDLAGSIIYHMFPTHQLLRLNIASAVCYTVSGYFIYHILKDFVPHTLLLATTLGSSLLTLSYIHCFNYNTSSMFNLSLAILLLTSGLFQNKSGHIAGSGFVAVVNIFFRVPNVLHLCMVLGIFLYCYNQNGHKWKDIVKPVLIYMGGCFAGGFAGGIVLAAALGTERIRSYVKNTFLTVTESDGGHSASSMIGNLSQQIKNGMLLWKQYVIPLLFIMSAAFLLCCLIRKRQKIIMICAGAVSLGYGFCVKSASEITTDESVSNADIRSTFCFLLLVVMVLSLIGIFAFYRTSRKISYLCLITLLLEIVITIGTDTGALYNTVFLYLPMGMLCCLLYQYYRLLSKKEWLAGFTASAGIVIASFSLMLLFYSGYYRATTYIYRDGPYPELTETSDITPFEGMRTSPERAELIRLIQEQLESYGGYSLITFGDCNIAAAVSDLAPYFTTAWPDLRSFSEGDYEQQLLQCEETGNYPVILFSTTTMRTYTGRLEGKEQILLDFIDDNDYELAYESDSLTVYVPTGE